MANELEEKFKTERLKDSSQTCAAFEGICQPSLGKVKANILFENELNNKVEHFESTFKVHKNIRHDVIIGRPDIKKHDLTRKCRSQFIVDKKNTSTVVNNNIHDMKAKKQKVKAAHSVTQSNDAQLGQAVKRVDRLCSCSRSPAESCCILESETQRKHITTAYYKKHLNELLDKDNELDELTKERLSKEQENSWDIYNQNSDGMHDELPTKIYSHKERHHKYLVDK